MSEAFTLSGLKFSHLSFYPLHYTSECLEFNLIGLMHPGTTSHRRAMNDETDPIRL